MNYYTTWKDSSGNEIFFPGDKFTTPELAEAHRWRVFFTYMAQLQLMFCRILPVENDVIENVEVQCGFFAAACISGPIFNAAKLGG